MLSKEKGSGEGGATAGHYSGGGGGEKARRAGHLWCVSVICSDEGLNAHTHVRAHTHFSVSKRVPLFCFGNFRRPRCPLRRLHAASDGCLCSEVERGVHVSKGLWTGGFRQDGAVGRGTWSGQPSIYPSCVPGLFSDLITSALFTLQLPHRPALPL